MNACPDAFASMDEQYLTIVERILSQGEWSSNRTGVKTWKLPHQIMQFDLEQQFPILTTKRTAFRSAVLEMLWIWQQQTSDVRWLHERNIHIWDPWVRSDGTIGKAYGYQLGRSGQVDQLLHDLKKDPHNRRMVVSLWNVEDLPDMALQPCAFLTMWDVMEGKLNCMLVQRSGDMPVGIPFNTVQYAVLVHLLAQVSGLRPGLFTHVINNAHVYENQVEAMKIQLGRLEQRYPAPRLLVNPVVRNFYAFSIDDIQLDKYESLGPLSIPVTV